jgi:hypothetical protein
VTEIPYPASARTGAGVPFDSLPSACPNPDLRASARLDPYWAAVWASGSQASWVTESVAARQIAAGIARLPQYLALGTDQAWAALADGATLARRSGALSAIDTWRTLTGEQMAAITGEARLASGRSRTMTELFAAGIADVGIFTNALWSSKKAARASLYRPSRTHNFTRRLAPHLTYPEWVAVTGGLPWESGSQYDRHNVLATELALRVAEWCEIGAVVGEKLSGWELLAHTGAGFPPASGTPRAADATLIRTDGARIAVEMTATSGPNFAGKVRRWAELLSTRRMADTGLCVVFVLAPAPEKQVRPGEMMTMVKKNIAAAARDFPGVNFDRTASRMFAASWQDWFPAAHRVNPGFAALMAERPTGPLGHLWESASLLDPFDTVFERKDPAGTIAVLDNLAAIRSVPHWLRANYQAPALWPISITDLGYGGIPIPAPSRNPRYKGKPLGAAAGVAGQTRPPARLRN